MGHHLAGGTRMAAVVALALLFGGCAGSDGGDRAAQGGGAEAEAGADAGTMYDDAEAPAARPARVGEDAVQASSAAALPDAGPAVIKTASATMALRPDRIDDAVDEATTIAASYDGFVVSSDVDAAGGRSAAIVVRLPSSNFEAALADLRALGKVRREQISGEDVSQEFVDLQARLRNWQAQQAILLDLMDEARTVKDTIRVQHELTTVQLEIERIRGRLNYLEDRTSFATITARFVPLGVAPSKPGPFALAWQRALDVAQGFATTLIVSLGFVIPALVLIGLAWLVFRQVRPRLSG